MRRLLMIPLALLLLAGACGGGDGDATTTTATPATSAPTTTLTPATTVPPTTSTSSTTTSSTTTSTLPAGDVWPLTGEPGESEDVRIVFVKIDNTSRGRPQDGLEQADLVFEIVVEGGVSRLLAAFHSERPEVVGPVRSTRETDAKILYPFAPFFSNSGGQGFVREMVNEVSRDIGHPRLGNAAYFRAGGRPSVYDLMLRPQAALDRVGPLSRPNVVAFDYGAAPPGGEPASDVDVSMSSGQTANWSWSEDDGLYLRGNNGNAHLAASGERISAANVMALEVEQYLLQRTDSAGSRVPDYRLVGSGPMTLFRDGMAFSGTWERDGLRTWYRFLDADGTPFNLAVGNTWIEMVPAGRSVDYS